MNVYPVSSLCSNGHQQSATFNTFGAPVCSPHCQHGSHGVSLAPSHVLGAVTHQPPMLCHPFVPQMQCPLHVAHHHCNHQSPGPLHKHSLTAHHHHQCKQHPHAPSLPYFPASAQNPTSLPYTSVCPSHPYLASFSSVPQGGPGHFSTNHSHTSNYPNLASVSSVPQSGPSHFPINHSHMSNHTVSSQPKLHVLHESQSSHPCAPSQDCVSVNLMDTSACLLGTNMLSKSKKRKLRVALKSSRPRNQTTVCPKEARVAALKAVQRIDLHFRTKRKPQKSRQKSDNRHAKNGGDVEAIGQPVDNRESQSLEDEVKPDVTSGLSFLEFQQEKMSPVSHQKGIDEKNLRTPKNSFLSTLPRSSRGRILKPVLSTLRLGVSPQSCYEYDSTGECCGLSSEVIDLTLDESLLEDYKYSCQGKVVVKIETPKPPVLPPESTVPDGEVAALQMDNTKFSCAVKAENPFPAPESKSPRKVLTTFNATATTLHEQPKKKQQFTKQVKPRLKSRAGPSKCRMKTVCVSVERLKGLVDKQTEETCSSPKYPPREERQQTEGSLKTDNSCAVLEEPQWTDESIRTLRNQVIIVPASSGNFWQEVAKGVGTGHSAVACQQQYYSLSKKPSKRKEQTCTKKPEGAHDESSLEKAADKGLITIHGRIGTLKRKRELRQALHHLDEDYSDNVWDAPYLKKKLRRIDVTQLIDDDDDVEENVGLCLPIGIPHAFKHGLGPPPLHTSRLDEEHTSSGLKLSKRRDIADKIVYRYQKSSKKPPQQFKVSQPKSVQPKLFQIKERQLRDIRAGELRVFHDSDNESDGDSDAFTDMDEEYERIISSLR